MNGSIRKTKPSYWCRLNRYTFRSIWFDTSNSDGLNRVCYTHACIVICIVFHADPISHTHMYEATHKIALNTVLCSYSCVELDIWLKWINIVSIAKRQNNVINVQCRRNNTIHTTLMISMHYADKKKCVINIGHVLRCWASTLFAIHYHNTYYFTHWHWVTHTHFQIINFNLWPHPLFFCLHSDGNGIQNGNRRGEHINRAKYQIPAQKLFWYAYTNANSICRASQPCSICLSV